MCCGSRILSLKNKEAKMTGYGYEVDFLPVGSCDKSARQSSDDEGRNNANRAPITSETDGGRAYALRNSIPSLSDLVGVVHRATPDATVAGTERPDLEGARASKCSSLEKLAFFASDTMLNV